MNNFRVYQSLQRLESAFGLVGELPFESEARSHYARYLCVLCSGYLESSIRVILADYSIRTARTTSGYVSTQLKSFRSPKSDNIVKLISSFDQQWAGEFELLIEGEPADAINSIVDNRHKIAHGDNVGISFHVISNYFESSKPVIELIDDKFRP